MKPTVEFGIEEEVYITEPEKPTLRSLYYMSKLLWSDPMFWYSHSDSNFARGKDVKVSLMGPIEVSTPRAKGAAQAVAELAAVRQKLSQLVDRGLLVPIGQLAYVDAPTLTSGLHIHVSGVPDLERAYDNIAHFLPLLLLITANSPGIIDGVPVKSYRVLKSYAIGTLVEDRLFRFQDIIISRRLGTIEVRVFDPTWDLHRVGMLLQCLERLATFERRFPVDKSTYRELRQQAAVRGYNPTLADLYSELCQVIEIPETVFARCPSDDVRDLIEQRTVAGAYAALDFAYRTGCHPFECPAEYAGNFNPAGMDVVQKLLGLLGYYVAKVPYKLGKVWMEWHKKPNWR
ncbi:MAG: hypothetical protein ACPLPR_04450 [Bacillota bacterium]